jgi:hypothetical protein
MKILLDKGWIAITDFMYVKKSSFFCQKALALTTKIDCIGNVLPVSTNELLKKQNLGIAKQFGNWSRKPGCFGSISLHLLKCYSNVTASL